MGKKNYLIEGVSGTGKSAVCEMLTERGYQAINGDKELIVRAAPLPANASAQYIHEHHYWDEAKVRAVAANQSHELTFFCGGSRNFAAFLDVFDKVFVLQVDVDTLHKRLDGRGANTWGSSPDERALILKLHQSQEDVPEGIPIDSNRPLNDVVNDILEHI